MNPQMRLIAWGAASAMTLLASGLGYRATEHPVWIVLGAAVLGAAAWRALREAGRIRRRRRRCRRAARRAERKAERKAE